MTSQHSKIALIELFPYHTECLYSQLLFLQGSQHVTLICDRKVESIVSDFANMCEQIRYYDFSKFSALVKLQLFLFKHKFDAVILNTAQGSRPLKFVLLPHRRVMKIVGTVHDTGKINTSFGQKLICNRLNGFYVLAGYIDKQIPATWNYRHQYFLPIYYPPYTNIPIDKKGEIWVSIPGAIEYKRRDYKALLEIAKNELLDKRIKFVLLGNKNLGQGSDFLSQIEKENLSNRFITFDGRVPNPLFYSYIKHSDYLLTLIHPNVDSFEAYMIAKISGMFPLAMAYNKTLLCHNDFAHVKDFDFKARYYNTANELVDILNKPLNQAESVQVDFEANKQRYLQLL